MLKTLRRLLGMTTAPRLVGMLVGPVTFACGLLTYRGWINGEQAAWVAGPGLIGGVGAVYWLLAQTDDAVADRAAVQAPQKAADQIIVRAPEAAMNTIVSTSPQVALDGVEGMAGVRFIAADKRYADANPNPNVISPADALDRLSHGGTSP